MFLESTTLSKCLFKKIVIKYIYNSSPSNIIRVSTLVVFDSLLTKEADIIIIITLISTGDFLDQVSILPFALPN